MDASWQQWLEVLENNLKTKWSSESETKEQTSEDQKKLAQEYAVQFAQELKTELDSWINQILKEQLEGINRDLGSIQQNLSLFSQKTDPSFGNQLISEIEKINADFGKPIEHLSEHLGGDDDSRFELLGFAFDVTSSIVGAVSGGIAGVFKFGGSSAAQPSIRQKVFERAWEKFSQSKDKFLEKIKEIVVLIIDNRVETVTKIAEQAVSLYEELLGKQERYQQETAEQQEAEKAWILQQRQELEQVQKNIEAILPS